MSRFAHHDAPVNETHDGSLIRERMHPDGHGNRSQGAWLIGSEILLLSLVASLGGVLAGGGLVVSLVAHTGIDLTALTSHNRYFTISGMVYPRATGYALGIPPLVAVGFSLLSSIWPIALIGRKKVADILRIV